MTGRTRKTGEVDSGDTSDAAQVSARCEVLQNVSFHHTLYSQKIFRVEEIESIHGVHQEEQN